VKINIPPLTKPVEPGKPFRDGDRAVCRRCNGVIVYRGGEWAYHDAAKPEHEPQRNPMYPARRRKRK
jgi:hypothetical protein